jgi:hypothetical protein
MARPDLAEGVGGDPDGDPSVVDGREVVERGGRFDVSMLPDPRIVPGMESARRPPTEGRLRRLGEELDEEGLGFLVAGDPTMLLEELDYALRPPVHERRIPSYGSIIAPTSDPEEWTTDTELIAERRTTVAYRDSQIRRFADGISSWAIRSLGGVDELVVFDRSAGSERDLVILASASGGVIVQRHPSGVVRVVGPDGVVRRDVVGWHHEPPFDMWLDDVPGCRRDGEITVLGRLLDFAVHDLGARGVGATLILHPTGDLRFAHEQRLPAPPELRIDIPHDLAPLRHALAQTDGATVFDRTGTLRQMGVHLVPSRTAEAEVGPVRGTRHTSAFRYSHDDPDAVVVVVSEDGPVTVVRAGALIGRTAEA